MRAREVNRKIRQLGGEEAGQRGSHRKFRATTATGETVSTIVPQHTGDIPIGTLRAIERALEPAFGKGWLQ